MGKNREIASASLSMYIDSLLIEVGHSITLLHRCTLTAYTPAPMSGRGASNSITPCMETVIDGPGVGGSSLESHSLHIYAAHTQPVHSPLTTSRACAQQCKRLPDGMAVPLGCCLHYTTVTPVTPV